MRDRTTRRCRGLRLESLEDRRLLAVFTVTNLLDGAVAGSGDLPGSLRQAIYDANNNSDADEIVWQPGLSGTISLTEGELQITDDVTINGPGAPMMTLDASGSDPTPDTNNGDGSRVFRFDNPSVTFAGVVNGLTLTGGDIAGDGGAIFNRENLQLAGVVVTDNFANQGGGIFNASSVTLTLTGSTISDNDAINGGGIFNGSSATLTLTGSTISGNFANNNDGGGIFNSGTATVSGSTISNNDAIDDGGGISNSGTATVSGSTISDNDAINGGGGIWNVATVTVRGSTISGNSASNGGGILNASSATLTGSTISGNFANNFNGGGILNSGNGDTVLSSTIVAENTTPDSLSLDVKGIVTSQGYNLIGDGVGSTGFGVTGDQVGTPGSPIDPLLGALQDNGGLTETHALLPGSPAIDAGNPTAMAGVGDTPEFDQRGAPYDRVEDGDGDTTPQIDIGSFEVQVDSCGEPFVPGGTIGDAVPDFYYSSFTGALAMNTDVQYAEAMIVEGPEPNQVDFDPPSNWTVMYFAGKQQWLNTGMTGGVAGAIRLATYDTGLLPVIDFPCVQVAYDDDNDNMTASEAAFTDVITDDMPPSATATADDQTQTSSTATIITVDYSDSSGVDIASLSSSDIIVTGPNGFSESATFVAATPSADYRSISATYELLPPSGMWGIADNGTYNILTSSSPTTSDVVGQAIESDQVIGSFSADIALEIISVSVPAFLTEGASGSFIAFADSVDPNLTYTWDFGDGESAEGQLVNHTYDDEGVYTVEVVVNDTMGNSDTESATTTVANVPPTANPDGLSLTVDEGSVSVNVLDNDTDPGTVDVLSIFLVDDSGLSPATGLFGTLAWDAFGDVTYSVDVTNPAIPALPIGSTLAEHFTYTVIDGDGGSDIGTIDVMINGSAPLTAATVFRDGGPVLGTSRNDDVDLADLDGDDDLDAFVTRRNGGNTVWFNDGSGTFTDSGQSLGAGGNIYAVLGDIDGDDDIDAVVAAGVSVVVWSNDGNGAFTNTQTILGFNSATDVDLADLDDNGTLDLFVADSNDSDAVFFNSGGTFSDSGQTFAPYQTKSIQFADIDDDGDLDGVIGILMGSGGAPNRVLINDGAGQLTDSGQLLGSAQTQHVALGDLDGDGDIDAMSSNSAGSAEPNQVWLNDGTGVFVDSGQRLGNYSGAHITLGDLDLDDDLDAFAANWFGQPDRIWLNLGGGVFGDSQQLLEDDTSSHVALGDIDGDGDLDALVATFDATESNRKWINLTINQPPNVSDDFAATGEDTALTIATADLLSNDTDPELDTLIVSGVDATSTLGATISFGANIGYDPTMASNLQSLPEGVMVTDDFDYFVDDGNGHIVPGTVFVEVTGANDAPIATNDTTSLECVNGAVDLTSFILSNDTDVDLGTVLSIASVDTTGTQGTVSLMDGQLMYDPAAFCATLDPGQTADDVFSYNITDGFEVSTAIVTVSVMAPFDPLDLNMDGSVDADDIDTLCLALQNGDQSSHFDLDGNGSVDATDFTLLLNLLGTLLGDANLDSVVDGQDFIIWNVYKFQPNDPSLPGIGWATADFNCDGVTDGSDFLVWNSNKFTSAFTLGALPTLQSHESQDESSAPTVELKQSVASLGLALSKEFDPPGYYSASHALRHTEELTDQAIRDFAKSGADWGNLDSPEFDQLFL